MTGVVVDVERKGEVATGEIRPVVLGEKTYPDTFIFQVLVPVARINKKIRLFGKAYIIFLGKKFYEVIVLLIEPFPKIGKIDLYLPFHDDLEPRGSLFNRNNMDDIFFNKDIK